MQSATLGQRRWHCSTRIQGGMKMEKTTMSVQELSSQMGISLPKAYELVKTPGFPAIRIGTRILIPVEGFRKWLVEQTERRLQS